MSRILFLFLVAFSFHGYSQNLQTYSVKQYSDVNGLPQNSIKSIAKDDAGYIWLATEDGLSRFDGDNFMHFDKRSTHAQSNRMYMMKRDLRTGNLYAETEHHELIQITKGLIGAKPFRFKEVFPNINVMIQVQEGPPMRTDLSTLLIQTNATDYYHITKDTLFFHNAHQVVATPFKHNGGPDFFVSNKQLMHYDNNGKFTLIEAGKLKPVDLKGDLAETEMAGSNHLKIYWNTTTDQTFFYLNKAIYQVSYLGETLTTTLLIRDFDLEAQHIWTIYYDEIARKLFLGSPTSGFFVVQQHLFQAEKPKKDLSSSVKYAMYPFTDHSVLFANGDLLQTDGSRTKFPLIKDYSNSFAMAIDQEKNIWTTKDFSIYKFSPEGDRILQSFNFPEKTTCLDLTGKKVLWIGTFAAVYAKDLSKPNAAPNLLLKLKDVSVLKEQGQYLWIGTSKGLYRYDLEKKNFGSIPEMANMHIKDIVIRGKEVWISTHGDGFYLYNNAHLSKMPLDKFGYLNTVHCILEDAKGFFWISTNKGLFQVAINDLLAYGNKQCTQVYYQYYNINYGFNTNEFNGGCQPCGVILKNGIFTFPSLIGAVMFNPKLLTADLPNKAIYIDKIFRDHESIKTEDLIHIAQGFGRLNIWVSSPYFGNHDNMTLEYKLAVDDSWASLIGTSVISFSTLSPGKHELLIRKAAGFGNHFTYKKLTIIVKPYVYQTWWFITLMVLAGLILIAVLLKKRTQRIIVRNERLETLLKKRTEDLEKNIVNLEESQYLLKQQAAFQKKLLGAITHDLKSPLKYMTIMGKQLYQHEAASEAVKDSLRTIYISANSMYHLTENLLNYSKLFLTENTLKNDYINLHQLVSEKINIFAEIAKYNGTTIRNNIPEDVILHTKRVMLALIVHNLLDNAIKFCPNGQITFGAESTKEKISFWIRDTGCGMPEHIAAWLNTEKDRDITEGLGLKMVKEFSAKMDMQIEVDSRIDEGTNIKLTLKHHNYI
ncbi:ATP-binding protein [Pedobacter gandavensis]|uniref:sensor histidine kinase n=1 Tax=Pedobacter gandavensis TaxID=2679963 RepID=UPI00292E4FF3|nr:ATP-binding protein [Pedobacter gandavensis]